MRLSLLGVFLILCSLEGFNQYNNENGDENPSETLKRKRIRRPEYNKPPEQSNEDPSRWKSSTEQKQSHQGFKKRGFRENSQKNVAAKLERLRNNHKSKAQQESVQQEEKWQKEDQGHSTGHPNRLNEHQMKKQSQVHHEHQQQVEHQQLQTERHQSQAENLQSQAEQEQSQADHEQEQADRERTQNDRQQPQNEDQQSPGDQQNTEDDDSIWRFNINVPEVLDTIKTFTGVSIRGNTSEKSILRERTDDPWSKVYTVEVKPDMNKVMSYVKNLINVNGRRTLNVSEKEKKFQEMYMKPVNFNFYRGQSYVEETAGHLKADGVDYPPGYYKGKIDHLLELQEKRMKLNASVDT